MVLPMNKGSQAAASKKICPSQPHVRPGGGHQELCQHQRESPPGYRDLDRTQTTRRRSWRTKKSEGKKEQSRQSKGG